MKRAIIWGLILSILLICFGCEKQDEKEFSTIFELDLEEGEILAIQIFAATEDSIFYRKPSPTGTELYRYMVETGERILLLKAEGTDVLWNVCQIENRIYLWQWQRKKVLDDVYSLLEVDLDTNEAEVVYEGNRKVRARHNASDVQGFGDQLLVLFDYEGTCSLEAFDTETREMKQLLQYNYEEKEAAMIRAIDVEEDLIHVLRQQSDETRQKSYWVDTYNADMKLTESLEVTKAHGVYGWDEGTLEFEYEDGILLHSNEAGGGTFFGKISETGAEPVIKTVYFEDGVYHSNGIYWGAGTQKECGRYRLGKSMEGDGSSTIYRLDMEKGEISSAQVPEEGRMVYMLQPSEDRVMIFLSKEMEDGKAYMKGIMVRMGDLNFEPAEWTAIDKNQ